MILVKDRDHIQNNRNFIGPNALVENCPFIQSVFIGDSCHLLSSTVRNCTILSSPSIPTKYAFIIIFDIFDIFISSIRVWNGIINNSILQWGCQFESGSNCDDSLLCEHTDTSCNAKIISSVIAPNTGVSSGECNSSLVGPFIGFHHNSVLISCMPLSSLVTPSDLV